VRARTLVAILISCAAAGAQDRPPRRIIDVHNGQIILDETPGGGTDAILTLPSVPTGAGDL